MNKQSKAFAKPQPTKRQRKALRGDNSAVVHSKANGDRFHVAGREYIGTPPVYQIDQYGQAIKVARGIPFVRA